jgi:cytochrome c peroxidase
MLAANVIWFADAMQAQTTPPVEHGASTPMEHLGRLLFWDPLLSGSRDVACATCHHPDFAYADGRDLSLGVGAIGLGPTRVDMSGGRIPTVKRNAQTILNTRFNGMGGRRRRRGFGAGATAVDPTTAPMFWDSRVRGLEAQALEPIKALEEMRGTAYAEADALDIVIARLRAVPEYVTLFEEAFGAGTLIDTTRLGQAIAAFERSLVAMDSPFDRFRAGDTQALTPQQRRGFDTFDEVGCDRCHRGTMLSDFDLESEGVAEHPGTLNTRRGRWTIPLPHAVAAKRGADSTLHAQRHARHARRRAQVLRQRPLGEPQCVERARTKRRPDSASVRQLQTRRQHERTGEAGHHSVSDVAE